MKFNLRKKASLFLIAFLILTSSFSYADDKKTIKFADAGWDSIKVHNAIAGKILENVFGYTWSEVPGGSSILHEGIMKDEIDINMETWTNNIVGFDQDLKDGKLLELGINFDDNRQGLYVPRYVIEGDKDRGIEALAPDLKHVRDLKNYPEVFPDEENPAKGRILGATPGWDVDKVLVEKYKHYGLDEDFIYFRPGSEAAHDASLTSAYERGEALVGYYWEPTWIMGQYDFVLLEDEPYEEEAYERGETAFPPVRVSISSSKGFFEDESNKEALAFLEKYTTSSDLTSQALAYMQENDADYDETANWFLTENKDLVKTWLTGPQASNLYASLEDKTGDRVNFLREFPFKLDINYGKIDQSVRDFSTRHDGFFGKIRTSLGSLVNLIESVLVFIPWFVLLLGLVLVGWKTSNKFTTGLIYGLALFLVGLLGLWELMLETLAIVIASVFISLVLGFPIGILLSSSDLANKIARPILDGLQTMPVFVYLIPALLFFGLGKPPAVIATTIYSIVPIIRLTNHGIRGIDREIVEASTAFGATSFQTLVNVQIPQALPTIMTGVNQTIMMAMSMVVTTSMIGATGLGMEVLISVNRIEIGRGLVSGSAVVILAVLLDRITQGLIDDNGDDING